MQVVRHRAGAELSPALRITYRLAANAADLDPGPTTLAEEALCFELVSAVAPDALLSAPVAPPPGADLLMRCDRVDFPPGAVAHLHTHPGPGLRVLLHGTLRIDTRGGAATHGPGDAWFESGPDPVHATASATEPSAFVRCLLLPRAVHGRSSIAYVRPEDADLPKLQRYTVFVDAPIALPAAA